MSLMTPSVTYACFPRAAIAIFVFASAIFAVGQSGADIYQFAGGADGQQPVGAVVSDSGGSLYGVTWKGGLYSYGTAYRLNPPSEAGAPWTKEILYNFTDGADGGGPNQALVFDTAGSLYGVANSGGDLAQCSGYGCGTIFKLSPPAVPGDPWTETTIYTFQNEIGQTALTFDGKGALYAASLGWTVSNTYIFKLSPPRAPGGAWTRTVLSTILPKVANNIEPNLVFDNEGALYGSVWSSIFKLSPPAGSGPWTLQYIYTFTYGADPRAGPVFDKSSGHLFGTATNGGRCIDACGVVYELAESGNVWHETNIYDFQGQSDGFSPMAAVTVDTSTRALYTTSATNHNFLGPGSVIQLTPTEQGSRWIETTLWKVPCVGYSYNSAVIVRNGQLFGTTENGGSGLGAVFEVSP
jgi:hypothetical protein